MIDTHCHLNWDVFQGQESEILSRAREAGITHLLCVGYDLESSRRAVELAEEFPSVFAAVGVHPNDCATAPPDWLEQLRELARRPKVLAIGETGMDFYRQRASAEQQEHFFLRQVELGQELGLPVIIHNRQAFDRLGRLLEGITYPKLVFHCWSEGPAEAELVLDKGCYLSFTGSVTFKNNRKVQETVRQIPVDRLLLETDAPFLTPVPRRGHFPNEPAFLTHIADFIANLRGISRTEIDRITTTNASQFFAFPNSD